MAKVEVYSSAHCPYCAMAKQLLERKGIQYAEIRVDTDPAKHQAMMSKSRQRTLPQVFINNKAIGGYADLVALDKSQQLAGVLA